MMKHILSVLGILLLTLNSLGQPTRLSLSKDKTFSLVFAYPITYVDRGSSEILAKVVSEQPNMLLLKAAIDQFKETNITVVTSDGSLYGFTVNYEPYITLYSLQIPPQLDSSIASYAANIKNMAPWLHIKKKRKSDLELMLTGVYYHKDILYLQLVLSNTGSIDAGIDYLRFTIQDRKKGKRTSTQEVTLNRLWPAGALQELKGQTRETVVIAFTRFTVPDDKFLLVELGEKNGGRELQLRINHHHLMRGVPIRQ
jgi:conjugative transposon TraN protein